MFFTSITLTAMSVAAGASTKIFGFISAIWVFLFDVLVYGVFILVLIGSLIIRAKPQLKKYIKKIPIKLSAKGKYVANIILDIAYYVVAVGLTGYMIAHISFSLVKQLKTNEGFGALPPLILDALASNTDMGKSVAESEEYLINLNKSAGEIKERLDLIEKKLHYESTEEFFATHDREYSIEGNNINLNLTYIKYEINSHDVYNTYTYSLIVCGFSDNFERCIPGPYMEVQQEEIIYDIRVEEFTNEYFADYPVLFVTIETNAEDRKFLLYPNRRLPNEYLSYLQGWYETTNETDVEYVENVNVPNTISVNVTTDTYYRRVNFEQTDNNGLIVVDEVNLPPPDSSN